MEEKIIAHKVLGISDTRQKEISIEIYDTIMSEKLLDVGIKKLMKKYDPESILAGMRLRDLVQTNNNKAKVRRTTQTMQNAGMN